MIRVSQSKRASQHNPNPLLGRGVLRWRVLLLALVALLALNVVPSFAAGSLTLILTEPPITTVQTGQSFTYRIDWECSANVGNCGTMTLQIPFDDTLFELVNISIVETGYTTNITTNPATITRPVLADGDYASATITLRARNTLSTGGTAAPVTVTGTITDYSGPPTTTVTVPSITVSNPTFNWGVTKTRVLPTTVDPAVWTPTQDAFVRYDLNYCSTAVLGNIPVNGAVLIDQIPAGAVLRGASPGYVRTDADGTPNPAGLFIRWELTPDTPLDVTDDLTGDVGCITRTIDLEFPAPTFSTGDTVTNTVRGYQNGVPADASVCVADCIGQAVRTDTLIAPTGTPNLSKGVSDTRPISHPGTGVFTLGMNTNDNNAGTDNLMLRDTLPLAASDSRPVIDVFEINAGTWPNDSYGNPIPAVLRYYTESSGFGTPAGTLALAGGTGGVRTISIGSGAATPVRTDLVTRIELEFNAQVPMAFTFTSPPSVRFTPRPGMAASDYDAGSGWRQYSNCVGSLVGGTPVGTDGCVNFRISNAPTTVTTFNKSASPSNVNNERIVQFAIDIGVGQESSNPLTNPSYTDVLVSQLEYQNYDVTMDAPPAPPPTPKPWTTAGPKFSVTFPAPLAGDTINDPYVLVEPNTPAAGQTRLTFFWTADPDDPRLNPTAPAEVFTMAGGPPSGANPLVLVPPTTGSRNVVINFRARVKSVAEGAFAGTYSNGVTVTSGAIDLICPGANDASATCDTATNFNVIEVPATRATKWVRSGFAPLPAQLPPSANVNYLENQFNNDHTLNTNWTFCPDRQVTVTYTDGRPPTLGTAPITFDPGDGNGIYAQDRCVALGNPGEGFQYLMQIRNDANMPLNEFLLYDILPHVGDMGINQSQASVARESQFMVWLNPTAATKVEVLTPAAWVAGTDYVVEYNTSTNPCRPEMTATTDPLNYTTAWHPGCNNTWLNETAAAAAGWGNIRSFRVRQLGTAVIQPNDSITLRVNAYIPTDAELQAIGITRSTTHPFNAPNDAQRAFTGEIAWNLFAYRFRSSTTSNYTLPAQPARVGIMIPNRLSVGNRVWIDDGGGSSAQANNRIRNVPSEAGNGVDGVLMQLYRWTGVGPVPSLDSAPTPGDPASIPGVVLVSETTTANGGYYLFEIDQRAAGIIGGGPPETPYDWINDTPVYSLRPGNYFVYVPPSNFDNVTDPLYGYVSSTGVDTSASNDNRDRGVDNGTGATTVNNPPVHGVRSNWFTLRHKQAPTGENDVYNGAGFPYGPYGRGTLFQDNNYSDLIRDFGFVPLMSIGNRIWYDTGSANPNSGFEDPSPAGSNDGILNNGELGVPNVTVRLYRVQQDGSGNPTYTGTTPNIQTGYFSGGSYPSTYNPVTVGGGGDYLETTTDANGYYQFEGLLPGNYVIFLPPSNFTFGATSAGDAVLAKYANSTGNSLADGIFDVGGNPLISTAPTLPVPPNTPFWDGRDNRDKGIENNFLATNGLYTQVVHLRPVGGQTTSETDLGTRNDGFGLRPENGNLTVDLGFYQPPMSLGNRVWRDYNNNGIHDAGEPGIAGVEVQLFLDENGDGIPDGGTLAAPGTPSKTTTTDADGYYRFDNLPPARYVVRVAPSNFAAGNVLEFFVNSTPTIGSENVDMNDNGITPATASEYATQGVYSGTIFLVPVSEPNDTGGGTHNGAAGEERDDGIDTIANGNVAANPRGQGSGGDRNSDLTVDFGFYRASSIGNRVWIDDGNGTAPDANGNPSGINNGLQDNATERGQGRDGVTVQLYRFIGAGDPTLTPFNPTDVANFALVQTRVTANNGYYLFDGLPEQDAHYYVYLPPANFAVGGALYQHTKSQPTFDNADDYNNNGAHYNPVAPDLTANGVVSNRIFVSPITNPMGWAPTTEHVVGGELSSNTSENLADSTATGANSRGRYRESDNFSDLTIDFSFFPERMSLGNHVWRDYNNNAVREASEPGIANVVVNLYTADGSGNPVEAAGSPLRTTTTDANGYYIFDGLLPGSYIVAIAPSNFAPGGVLENLTNSNNNMAGYNGADNQTDLDDNGIDQFDTAYGYRSVAINLALRAEPTSEVRSGNPVHGNPGAPYEDFIGRQLQRDDNSDLTVDFGFYRASSIGNRVWIDDGAGGGVYNDGIQNGNEPNQGIANVTLELWRYTGAGVPPVFSPSNPFNTTDLVRVRMTTTDANGYYLFDGLQEENATYYVRVHPDNFVVGSPSGDGVGNALVPYDNSFPTFDNVGVDRNDNGVNTNYPATHGIVSNPITVTVRDAGGNPLATGWAPTTEHVAGGELSPNTSSLLSDPHATGANSRGRHRETDDFSDLTIDFGFLAPRFSLGNRVWFDLNNNGVWDPAATSATGTDEAGVPNVAVRIYRDNGDNTFNRSSDTLVATTTTDANGYYLFDNLEAGNYFVWIDELMFRAGGPLLNYYSSQPTESTDADGDRNDNGIYPNEPLGPTKPTPEVGGVVSPMITLAKNSEPINEHTVDPSNNPAHDDGTNTYRGDRRLDSNSNLTVDFGFYKPMSIGNRVWLDINGDGVRDAVEPGIAGVTLELWVETTGDNDPDAPYLRNVTPGMVGIPPVKTPYTTTTDANGYYLFDNLPPGRYVVIIPANQPALNGMSSTVDNIDPAAPPATVSGIAITRTDNNDNGIGTADWTNPVRSVVVTLVLDNEPEIVSTPPETDLDPVLGSGRHGEEDRNSNLTIDFGFTGQLMALGNRVWFDPNNNGLQDLSENGNGIQNVRVSLYRDVDNNGIPDGPAIATTLTDASGYYLFDNLAPGRYIVGLDNSNFGAAQPLEGLLSSTGNYSAPSVDPRDDRRDNGIDTLHATYGLLSHSVNLVANQAPQNELPADSPVVGAGGSNANSDLTVDFGLYRPMSIGNRVWLDNGAGGGVSNDGIQNGAEAGVPNVIVRLYRDVNNDGIPVPAGLVGTTTTDANGYYLFDGLGEDNYIVLVAPENFQAGGALLGLNSSTPTFADNVDRNDNGINAGTPSVDGVRSNVVELRVNTNPTGETDLSGNTAAHGPNSRGKNGETDNNSNLTIDFGFVGASLSLGNRIWFDEGAGANARNGVHDLDEVGVPNGVRVSLYRDTNNDGVPDGPAIATTLTTSNGGESGYYLFDNLAPGRYIVGIDASNFAVGQPLEGYGSSPDPVVPRAYDLDREDYGRDNPQPYLGNGILSRTITLSFGDEPVGEADLGAEGTGAGGVDANSNLTVDFGLYRPLSIGNNVWFDTGTGANYNNGLRDAGEVGIAGVTVRLYRDDGDSTLNVADTLVATTTTDALGYYLFDNLTEGNYFVVVADTNFGVGQPLEGFVVSTPNFTDNVDRNNNGLAPLVGFGVPSGLVTLTYNTAPTGETDLSGNAPAHGPNFRGRNGEADKNSNLTIDFGFVAPVMSIGNRVWLDDGAGGGMANDGIQNGGERGIGGVTVQLFAADAGGNPVGSPIRTTTTTNDNPGTPAVDEGGYYLFDNLPPGRYVVVLPASNFSGTGVLLGHLSSTGQVLQPNVVDALDNGNDPVSPASTGVRSPMITLTPGAMPVGEDEGGLGRGLDSNGNPLPDNDSNLTVDFGFVRSFDWGDNPDSYGTTLATNGPRHGIISTLFMGSVVDAEPNGQPSGDAYGDDTNGTPDDEDSLVIPRFVANTPQTVLVKVFNNTGQPAYLAGWVDFSGNGQFELTEAAWFDTNSNGVRDAGENLYAVIPSSPTAQFVNLTFYVPNDADITTGGQTYARFRLTTDTALFTSGNPANNDPSPLGAVSNGEVEDYRVTQVVPPGLAITKSNGVNAVVAGAFTEYEITVANSGAPLNAVRIFDDIFALNTANALVPGSATWTCQTFIITPTPPAPPSGVPSCVAGINAPTANGVGIIDQLVDLPTYTGVRFTLRVRVSPTATNADAPIVNTATANTIPATLGSDSDAIIFDPPFGQKVGQVLGGNIIRWTQVWFSTGLGAPATITDPIQAGQTFNGNLVCTAFGTTVTNTCGYDIGTNTVTWTGFIGDAAPGNPNRVEISFDVIVPGPGTYTNTATIQTSGGNPQTATTTGNVAIAGADDAQGLGILLQDPAIVKRVNPSLALPGEVITWEVTILNPNNAIVPNVTVSDTLPAQLIIKSVSASRGTPTVSGQTVTLALGDMSPLEVVTLTISTVLDPKAAKANALTNIATLEKPYDHVKAEATVFFVSRLPDTGETPAWRTPLLVLLAVMGLAIVVGVAGWLRSQRRQPKP